MRTEFLMKLGASASYWDGRIKKVEIKHKLKKKKKEKVTANSFVPQNILDSNLERRFKQVLASRKFIHLFVLNILI